MQKKKHFVKIVTSLVTVLLTLFFPMFAFDPPENIRKPLVFLCFQGHQKGTLGRKGLKMILCLCIYFVFTKKEKRFKPIQN